MQSQSLEEKKKILEILEAKDECIKNLENQIENHKVIASEIQEKLIRTQELLQSAESVNEQVCHNLY